jgi:4-diphosphocytidyl-2-C-methyl-D-erythritol kinase
LLALNELSGNTRSLPEMEELAAALGSDVPFFLHRSAAWCEGRGELVRRVATPDDFFILLFKPPFGVPTPWAYQKLAESLPLPGIPMEPQSTAAGMLVNDLERPVFAKYQLLALVKQSLLEQPETLGALMSGSGSTMFALTQSRAGAELLRARLLEEFGSSNWTAIITPYHS